MPPAKKTATPSHSPAIAPQTGLLKIGELVNLSVGGRTLLNREVLDFDQRFIKVTSDVTVAPQTKVALYPFTSIESIGLVNES
jgi:hypothetical protein